jgi:hypothetical protein
VINWEQWFHGVGNLPVMPPLDTSIRDSASQLAAEWIADEVPAVHAHDYSTFTPGQRVAFFDELLTAQVKQSCVVLCCVVLCCVVFPAYAYPFRHCLASPAWYLHGFF